MPSTPDSRTPSLATRREGAGPLASLSRWLRVALAALALTTPALWNGVPLLYPDTPTYVRGAEAAFIRLAGPGAVPAWLPTVTAPVADAGLEGGAAPPAPRAPGLSAVADQVVLAGRSVYYGAVLEVAQLAGSLWWAVVFQALCAAWLLQLLWADIWRLPASAVVPVAAGLAWVTPLGLYTGLLMPDVYAGLAIVAAAALVLHGGGLRAVQRLGLWLLVLFALLAHSSHTLVIAGLLLMLWATQSRWRGPVASAWPPALAALSGAVALAVLAEVGFARAVERAVGAPPLRLPHLTARLVDGGPGTVYLQTQCPRLPARERWAACDFVDRYPLAWTDFLFEADPARGVFAPARPDLKRRLSEEQVALAWQVLRQAPGPVLADLAADLPRQLLAFDIDIWGLGPRELAMYRGRVPPDLLAAMARSRGAQHPGWQSVASALTLASVTAAALVLAALMLRRRAFPHAPGTEARLWPATAVLLAGLVLNAAVCGLLASPLDRFQARVVWLVPLLAAAWWAGWWATRGRSPRAACESAPPAAPPGSAWPAPQRAGGRPV